MGARFQDDKEKIDTFFEGLEGGFQRSNQVISDAMSKALLRQAWVFSTEKSKLPANLVKRVVLSASAQETDEMISEILTTPGYNGKHLSEQALEQGLLTNNRTIVMSAVQHDWRAHKYATKD